MMRAIVVGAGGALLAVLQSQPDIDIVAVADRPGDLPAVLQQRQVDLLVLDGEWPHADLQTLRRDLKGLPAAPVLVHCLAYGVQALDAMEGQDTLCLVHPVTGNRVRALVEAVVRRQRQMDRPHLVARLGSQVRQIPVDRIRYLLADEKYVLVDHPGGQDLVEDSLRSLEMAYPDHFVRIHRRCLVSRSHLRGLERDRQGTRVILDQVPQPLDVSRRCAPLLRRLLDVR